MFKLGSLLKYVSATDYIFGFMVEMLGPSIYPSEASEAPMIPQ